MIKLYDTLQRKKLEFVPHDPKRVTMYVCGPTVYGRAHIGNARPAVVFDVLARLLRHHYGENHVVYARNVTDVDDKIMKAAAEEGVEPAVITARYEQHYLEDMRALGVRDPDLAPHATREIAPMIAMIERLIDAGHAYAADGHVLFSVPSDPAYGALSGRDREGMIAGARVEVAPYKRDPADFVLWKPAKDGEIAWDSPWERGRPGWHIECSAMIEAHLGDTIDIHGGGIDLVFPHHENEIAQSRCAHGGAPLARYWVHNGFVDFGSEKMSKSLGNVVTPGELLAAGHKGETLRLALLSAHYRQPLPWTDSLIAQAKATLDRWYRVKQSLDEANEEIPEPQPTFLKALSDDLNTPAALAVINAGFEGALAEHPGRMERPAAAAAVAGANLLGLLCDSAETWFRGSGDARIDGLVAERDAAKRARDFATADRIRDELKTEGIILEDGPGGTTWRRA